VAQGVGPEFKPQYCKTKQNKTKNSVPPKKILKNQPINKQMKRNLSRN
jgi:hypothetical protein